jgi:phosphatidylglycerophosphate synthase
MSTVDRILSIVCLSFGFIAAIHPVNAGIIALSLAALVAIHAVVGRALGFHRKIRWTGGGDVTLVGELSFAGFFGSAGGFFVFDSPIFFLTGLLCVVVGYVSQERANKQFRRKEEEL